MSGHTRWSSRRRPPFTAAAALLAALLMAGPLGAQDLPLKSDLPNTDPYRCTPEGRPAPPTDEEQSQAQRLAASADQAVILGDVERARDLLARAIQLDPSSSDLAFRYGRILEDTGETRQAMAEFCRTIALRPESEEGEEAARHLEALSQAGRLQIPDDAVTEFTIGVRNFEGGRFEGAAQAFDRALALAPDWPEAVYNRGVSRMRAGRTAAAVDDLERYLSMRPDAPDALAVSQRVGQLQSTGSLANPTTALTLGVLFPGMGQFYSGRALGGFTVLTLAAGAAAAGYFIEEVHVRCLTPVEPGDDCPPDQVLREETERPYLTVGIGAAGAVAVIGAIEAFVKARGRRASRGSLAGADLATRRGLHLGTVGRAGLSTLGLSASGTDVTVSVLRVSF